MVSSFTPNTNPNAFRSIAIFPLSSPPIEPHTTLKPSNGSCTLSPTPQFLKSQTFDSAASDNDHGDSSSNEDEFRLERYSSGTSSMSHGPSAGRRHVRKQKNIRDRPGLNIVTDFAISPRRARMHGLIVDKVQSQRPRMKQKYTASIVSAKAEHLTQTGLLSPVPRFQDDTSNENHNRSPNYTAAIAPRSASTHPRQRNPNILSADPVSSVNQTLSTQNQNPRLLPDPEANTSRRNLEVANAQSPDSRSIVIGLSVPEHEAEAHAYNYAGDSALSMQTPDTPAIIVTPSNTANDRAILKASTSIQTNPKPYKTSKGREKEAISDSDLTWPRNPGDPPDATRGGTVVSGAIFTRSRPSKDAPVHIDDTSEYESDTVGEAHSRRVSSESKEQILPSPSPETGRHKSQGWWNLMLSPMLSRKGTIKSLATQRTSTPPLPSLPYHIDAPRSNLPLSAASDSPQTPRRLGIASARASVWSRWTTWEKARDGVSPVDEKKDTSFVHFHSDAHRYEASGLPQASITKAWENGTAAEYYHACAVEQVNGIQYFECENHSCEEQLPKLLSIFDHQQKVGADALVQDQEKQSRVLVGGIALPSTSNLDGPFSEDGVQVGTKVPSPTTRQSNAASAPPIHSKEPQGEDVKGQSPTLVKGFETNEARDRLDSGSGPAPIGGKENSHEEHPTLTTTVVSHEQPLTVHSPGPVSPAMNRAMASQGAMPLTEVFSQAESQKTYGNAPGGQTPAVHQPQPGLIAIHNHFRTPEAQTNDAPTSVHPVQPSERSPKPPVISTIQTASSQPLEEDSAPRKDIDENKPKVGLLAKMWCFGRKPKPKNAKAKTKTKKRRWAWLISILLLLIVIACVLLAMLLTRGGDGTPVQNEWLNLTGYPPMPTGISTIARPDLVKQQNQCVAPSTLWSCSLPKENQAEIAPNAPDQPNFRFQISFQNGTVPANMTIPVQDLAKRALSLTRRASNPFTIDPFEPNPVPPSRADQIFMGNTTDNITEPFDGEKTPFFITFIPSFPIDPSNLNTTVPATSSRLLARQSGNVTVGLPPPDVLDDGSAAPANLIPISPYPSAQPIKLYNRGLDDEHYGFYMYYDKSIFMRSMAPLDNAAFSDNGGIDPLDEDGGSDRNQARLRCTLSQSRFLVKIWTNPRLGADLLVRLSENNGTNSATDFSRPGSFPYPTTLSIDRHGGNINKKGAYCYGVDQLQVIQDDVKSLIPEFRGFGGPGLVNPAPSLINGTGEGFSQSAGGIDGGIGGCECVWQNWN